MPFKDYSLTPSANKSIAGNNVGEGGPAAAINNAVRQIMTDGRVLSDATTAVTDRVVTAEKQLIIQGQMATGSYYPGARSYVPQGAAGTGEITGGSGGANGTFNLAFTGGDFDVDPSGYFVVEGGAVTSITITGPGLYIGGTPTPPTLDFSASTGLTSASATLTTGYLVQAGKYYYTDHASDVGKVALFQNVGNVATEVDADVSFLDIGRAEAAADRAEAAVSLVQGAPLTFGNFFDRSTTEAVPNSDATTRGTNGISFATTASGAGSEVRATFDRPSGMRAGEVYTFRLAADHSATFTRAMSGQMYVITNGGGGVRTLASSPRYTQAADRFFLEIDYEIAGDEIKLVPTVTTEFAAPPSSAEWYELTDIVPFLRTPLSDADTANGQMLQAILSDSLSGFSPRLNLGNQLQRVKFQRSLQNGAQSEGRFSITVPAGQSGYTTDASVQFVIDEQASIGRVYQMLMVLRATSATFTRELSPGFLVQTDPFQSPKSAIGDLKITPVTEYPGYYAWLFQYECGTDPGDLETSLVPYLRLISTAPAAADETIEAVAFVTGYGNTLLPGQTSASEMVAQRIGEAILDAPTLRVAEVVDPGADIVQAVDAVTTATAGNQVRIDMGPGTYALSDELFTKDYVDLQGRGPDSTLLTYSLPNNAPTNQLNDRSGMFAATTGYHSGFGLDAFNCKYAIHCDTGASIKDKRIRWQNITLRHFGNRNAPATALLGTAMGCGSSSGGLLSVDLFDIWALDGVAFSCHNNPLAIAPTKVTLSRGALRSDNSYVMTVLAIGSRQADVWTCDGITFGGPWNFSNQDWYYRVAVVGFAEAIAKDPADHWEWTITLTGCSPAVFENGDAGQALRIDSKTTGSSSSVTVYGDLVKWLNDGTSDNHRAIGGTTGRAGAALFWGNIQASGLTLPERLAACAAAGQARSMVVTADGASPVTVTLNGTYADNAAVVAAINGQLGTKALATIDAPGARRRPLVVGEEVRVLNSSTSWCPMGTVMAYDADQYSVRPMTSADPVSRRAGVVWEADGIAPGESGRIKTGGYLPLGNAAGIVTGASDILRSDTDSFAFGDTFSIDPANPGRIIKGGAGPAVFVAISASAVRFA